MRQFHIARLKGRELAVLLQHNLLDERETRVVAPLFVVSSIVPTHLLHPVIKIGRRNYLLATEKLAAIAKRNIGTVIGSAEEREYEIRRALNLVFCGL
ncbi:MAG: CcdB family protein [Hyphomicrobium sp.]